MQAQTDHSWPASPLRSIPYGHMSRSEWLSARQQLDTIGGSDVGAIMGLNKYVSPRILFYRMVGIAPPRAHEDKVHLSLGLLLERGIAAAWRCYEPDEQAMATRIVQLMDGQPDPRRSACKPWSSMLINPDYPWLHATIDFRITYIHKDTRPWLDSHVHDGILETKNMSARVSDMYADGIPPYYTPQVLTYMAVTGTQYAEVAAIVGGSTLVVKPFIREEHEEDIQRVLDITAEFYAAVVKAREACRAIQDAHPSTQPYVDGMLTTFGEVLIIEADKHIPSWIDDVTEEYLSFVSERHLLHLGITEEVDSDDDIAVLAARIDALGEAVRERKELQGRLKTLMADRGITVATTPTHKVTWNRSLRITKKKEDQ